MSLKNWANAPQGDWEKGWTKTFNYVQLNKGTNTIRISCEQGNQCNANFDQLWLTKGWATSSRAGPVKPRASTSTPRRCAG